MAKISEVGLYQKLLDDLQDVDHHVCESCVKLSEYIDAKNRHKIEDGFDKLTFFYDEYVKRQKRLRFWNDEFNNSSPKTQMVLADLNRGLRILVAKVKAKYVVWKKTEKASKPVRVEVKSNFVELLKPVPPVKVITPLKVIESFEVKKSIVAPLNVVTPMSKVLNSAPKIVTTIYMSSEKAVESSKKKPVKLLSRKLVTLSPSQEVSPFEHIELRQSLAENSSAVLKSGLSTLSEEVVNVDFSLNVFCLILSFLFIELSASMYCFNVKCGSKLRKRNKWDKLTVYNQRLAWERWKL